MHCQEQHVLRGLHASIRGSKKIAVMGSPILQQASELLNHTRRIVIEDRKPYFDALALADKGDMSALQAIITQAIFGVEFVPGSPCQMSGQKCPSCADGVMDVAANETGVECNKCGLFIPA